MSLQVLAYPVVQGIKAKSAHLLLYRCALFAFTPCTGKKGRPDVAFEKARIRIWQHSAQVCKVFSLKATFNGDNAWISLFSLKAD